MASSPGEITLRRGGEDALEPTSQLAMKSSATDVHAREGTRDKGGRCTRAPELQ